VAGRLSVGMEAVAVRGAEAGLQAVRVSARKGMRRRSLVM
jgi:hypothetical protein